MRATLTLMILLCGCLASDEQPTGLRSAVADACGGPPSIVLEGTDLAVLGSGSGILVTDDQWDAIKLELEANATWQLCVLTFDPVSP